MAEVADDTVHPLACLLLPAERALVARYLLNALSLPERRSIRAANARFASLITSTHALALFQAAGFTAMERQGETWHEVPLGSASDARLQFVLDAIEQCAPTLLSLPEELLLRILSELSAEDLSATQRASKQTGPLASAGALWLRFCPPRFWRQARAAGLDRLGFERWAAEAPIGFTSDARPLAATVATSGTTPASACPPFALSWQLVHRMVGLWDRLHARCGTCVSFSLRPGLTLDALAAAPHHLIARLPAGLIASLMVHDGQVDNSDVGLLFAGARLLSLSEIATAAAEAEPTLASDVTNGHGGVLPLTNRVGFQQLAVRVEDGAICMCAGFDEHVKARNWPAFVERVLWDTV